MTDVMSTKKPTLNDRWYCPDDLLEHAAALEAALPVTMTVWKAIKAVSDALAFVTVIYLVYSGLDPFVAAVIGLAMAQGPEFVEWWLVDTSYYEFRERGEDDED